MTRSKVIIIGAGLAGMVAAVKAGQEGADVILLDRGPIGTGSNSSLANGQFSGPTPTYDTQTFIRDTLTVGRDLNRHTRVHLLAQRAPEAFTFLRSLGVPLQDSPSRKIVESPVPSVIRGITMVKKIAEKLRASGQIRTVQGFYTTDIVVRDNRVYGIRGISRTAEEIFIPSAAVILATGGAGAIYLRNDNQKKILGQGYYLAAKAGLALWDMEFVQFFPLVLAEPRLPQLILFPPYPPEARLVNNAGEDMPTKFGLGDINRAVSRNRDEFSAKLFEENKRGLVRMDFRNVPDQGWAGHPFPVLSRLRFDFRAQPVAVSPAAHFFMGGISADDRGQTDIEGLFACGEILWGLHGANRMGGNALTECVVTGMIAGHSAAQRSKTARISSLAQQQPPAFAKPQQAAARINFRDLLRRVRKIAWEHAGIFRSEQSIREGLMIVEMIKAQAKKALPANPSERIAKEDLTSALFVLEAVLTASLGRQESRGSFIRSDFPQEDDKNWKRNSCLQYEPDEGGFAVGYIEQKS